jgi:hypothetical protein
MPHHDSTVRCQPATVLTAHGTLPELDLLVEIVLTLGATTAAQPPVPCPQADGCHVLRLCVLAALPREDFHRALRAALAHRN